MGPLTTALVVFTLTGIGCGAILAIAARVFAVEEDPRLAEICAILPNGNCGGCGWAGCGEYAKAILFDKAELNLCTVGGTETAQKLAKYMGVTVEVAEKKAAIVLCRGNAGNAPRRFLYNGVADCAAANAVDGGDKICRYGCLGYGSCARACPVNAISMDGNLAMVHPELCISCGKCVKTCPRKLIKLVPESRHLHVFCSSLDKGPIVKKACKVGCIACTLCTKLAPDSAIAMNGALAVVDYAKPITKEAETLVQKCPGHCIQQA